MRVWRKKEFRNRSWNHRKHVFLEADSSRVE